MSDSSLLRSNGRLYDELRPCRIEPYPLDFAEGSALIHCGLTRVLCAATLQEGVPRFLEGQQRGWLTAEYSMLPRSTQIRTSRESHSGRLQGRTQEIQRLIGRSLRAAVKLEELGEYTILVDCDVLQADGGTRTAAITGGYVAVALALRKQFPDTFGSLLTQTAAVSVGVVEGVPMLDLEYVEDSAADADMNVVRNSEGEYLEIQSTAERVGFDRASLSLLLDLADKGISELMSLQIAALER